MINAGAIATAGQVPGTGLDERFERIRKCYSSYAGRELSLEESVYSSESATGFRNRAIAYLLRNSEIIHSSNVLFWSTVWTSPPWARPWRIMA